MSIAGLWRPRAGNFGFQLVSTSSRIGTGGTSVGNNATTSITLAKPAGYVCELVTVSIDALVAGVAASGDILIQVFKRDNSGTPANKTLTGTKSLTSSVIATTDKAYAVAITGVPPNTVFQSGDTCRVDIVTTDTVNTQPVVTVVAMWAIIKRIGT